MLNGIPLTLPASLNRLPQTISIFNVLVLQFPNKTRNTIDKLFRRFWWDENEEKRKLHTIYWIEMCKSIDEGGLSIWDIRSNNLALLARTC